MRKISLRLKDVCKSYPGVRALSDISIELHEGEVHALLGENGAGKSTLCKIISGAEQMDSGEYYIGNERIHGLTPHSAREKGIGIIYQEFNLISNLKVYENIFLGKELRKGAVLDKAAMINKTLEIFRRLKITVDPNARIAELSVAYKQLVEIGKAVLENAKILCMDEPTAPLTNQEVKILFDLIKDLKHQGVTIVYISHRIEELFDVSDRVTILRDGEYIDTLNTKETSRKQLVSLMVGRELGEDYPVRLNQIGTEILRVENLSIRGKLKNISFSLRKGEVLGFAGLVGAGRTEVMRALFGADKRSTGDIRINGNMVFIKNPRDAVRYGISLIPEDRKGQGVSLTMKVRENISLIKLTELCRFFTVKRKEEQNLVKRYIEALNIKTPTMEQKTKNLSGGNQQKVAVAKWLAVKSEIIILDEPTRGIDVGAKQEIYALINELCQQGKAIVMVSSEMPELIGMSDRIMVMCEGRILGELNGATATQEQILNIASGGKEGEV
jgi:ribose transport system ATP-binding protein